MEESGEVWTEAWRAYDEWDETKSSSSLEMEWEHCINTCTILQYESRPEIALGTGVIKRTEKYGKRMAKKADLTGPFRSHLHLHSKVSKHGS